MSNVESIEKSPGDKPPMKFLDQLFAQCIQSPQGSVVGISYYDIDGAKWTAFSYDDSDSLSFNPSDDIHLEVKRAYSGDGFLWSWSKKLSENVNIRYEGKDADVLAACQRASGYRPQTHTLDYLDGPSVWYETEPGRFYTSIDDDEATVLRFGPDDFSYSRRYKHAGPIFECFRAIDQKIGGNCQTLASAMIACIDAPEKFKRACAAFIASLREVGAS